MKKDWVLTPESFESLLAWLDLDREEAGKKYENIRRRLVTIFTCRGCREPEELADETFNRVARRLKDIRDTYIGDPVLYFYGVANKVHLEYLRRKPLPLAPTSTEGTEEFERNYACLERCIQNLTTDNQELVVQYYQDEKRAKIEHRKQLAEQLGIAVNALRIRAHRIRTVLQECVKTCLQEAPA